MKKFLNKFVLAAALVAMTFVSCDDGLTELNVDPNNPTAVPAENLMTQAQFSLYSLTQGRALNGEWGMLMVQQWTQNEYTEESRYDVDGNDFDGSFQGFYANALNELDVAAKLVQASEIPADLKANRLAILNILKADAFHQLTDLWGAIPYTQALNSVDFPLPAYDDQQSVYNGILAALEGAANSITTGQSSFDSGDVIYGGDMASWKKLANSLILRVAMRMVDADETTASGFISRAVSSGVFESNADNALFRFDADPNIANPLYVDNVVNTRDDFSVSAELIAACEAAGDPRLDAFSAVNATGDHVGIPYGLTDAEAILLKPNSSRPAAGVRAATAPHVIMDYAEVQFIISEARQRGILTGDAANAYAEGIKASMEYWIPGVDQAAIDGYVMANPYDAANWKASIGLQKWFAFYMNGLQAWAEWRRLDQPVLQVPAAAIRSAIPVRLPYPISEEERNGTQVGATGIVSGDLATKMWWDKN